MRRVIDLEAGGSIFVEATPDSGVSLTIPGVDGMHSIDIAPAEARLIARAPYQASSGGPFEGGTDIITGRELGPVEGDPLGPAD